ncbi:Lrp/AsnC family transcriptional regulator [Nonomuraea roseoviolacea]|uniref:DNA-binding Lrp family transcriptional regulator n=1 Tax=Nonomuraea roseoviolacea subsp. carminata TaxID=160689 RepID=A0ABT1KC56_9ACTN|nr:AsnC family transcriptional regulator [Nonomuraea roseoviolacea]MCP2351172.1 DNA-binding Lrp family transcriptional regulator [Nonomuraea roseoviolacea subsp. carminata]
MDDVDRALVHALHIDGRAPFSRVAEVLDVSPQTVTRRYRRLRREAGLRVVGLADHGRSGHTQWVVRLSTTPAAARPLAHSLARRADTSWVKLTSGGTEIFAMVHAPDATSPPLLHDVPRRSGITAVSAHCVLHTYLGGPAAWHGRLQTLDPGQRELLRPALPPAVAGPPRLTEGDHALIDALRHDGRAPHADLAAVTGWSQATVARRLADLRARGALFFDVEIDASAYGVTTQALLWMAVAPGDLDRVATALAGHHELATVIATTGSTNLLACALCSGPADLHRYLVHRLGALDGVRTLETAPVHATLKAAGHLPADGTRLARTGWAGA